MLKFARFGVKHRLFSETITFLLAFALLLSPAVLSGQGKSKKSNGKKSALTGSSTSTKATPEAARALILTGNLDKAISFYSSLLERDTTSISLSGEYAYALALDGIYDAALARLDKVWGLRGKNLDIVFYTSQVYALMGYNQLAGELWKESNASAPDWIASNASQLLEKYKYRPSEKGAEQEEDVVTQFKRANGLTAQNKNLEAMALFEGIINQYPGEYLPYVGYSITLEKNEMYNESVQTLEKAISLTSNAADRDLLNKRLVSVRNKTGGGKTSSGNVAKLSNKLSNDSYKYTAYAGGTIAKSYTSLNARFGTYKTGVGSTSVDVGITSASGSTALNLGFLTYYRKKILVAGFGLTGALASGSSTVYLKISMGASFMNKKRTSSLDIFIDGQEPLMPKGAVTTMGLSVGHSVYFGKR